MKVEHLRHIGKQLFAEIGKTRLKPFTSESLGKGAGGDRTFPIDKKAEDIIISSLQSLNEPLSIISEEAGLEEIKGGGRKVLIDPIDGSKNAITGIPFYCTSIAVSDGDSIGSIFMGYVINLLTGDEFWAEKGKGAFFNGERIYTQKDDIFYLIAYEAQSPKNDIPKIMKLLAEAWRTRCWGAMALDISYLAYGAVSVFVTPSLSRSFDFASGYLLVEEAGGVFTDINGKSIDSVEIGLKRSAPLLASGNKQLHEKALKLLNM
ncbi:inorganic polyphosphate/ATP-NAD kinase (Poly(P)/ATP NAD kinase) [Dissulfurispira thermophila]|uniref:Inorganic polyphosphate/ATP-NAD kinase (Poly(P)/ATP NAD kinase) n=2 Tax=root TaxID=1 RepID=A0A7G1H247_9BACT|nr:inositol monophosphatase family protein [Dissulfurispira thermophila]BCB95797.1 inorganic polyphosphate/ATP-NAD kinase (Poly(P)/ATP NAD kinase) [Dissulfurispira thermophila]